MTKAAYPLLREETRATQERESLSVTIVTLNEAHHVGKCIDSVSWADEVVVVDCGSTDQTREISRSRGANVIEHSWRGYAAQKNLAIENTQHSWVLSLDADEYVTAALRDRILAVLQEKGPAEGYRIPRKNIFFGKWLRHGELWPDHQIRLFRKKNGRFLQKPVHESVEVSGRVEEFSEPMEHHSYERLGDYFARQVRYAELASKDLELTCDSLRFGDFTLRPLWRFVKSYFLKSGWRDGFEGFIVSAGSSFYVFMRAAYLWENRRRRETP